jgi:hypothetical protein
VAASPAVGGVIEGADFAAIGRHAVAISMTGLAAPDRADVAAAALGVGQRRASSPARAAIVRVGADVGLTPITAVAVAVLEALIADSDVAGA